MQSYPLWYLNILLKYVSHDTESTYVNIFKNISNGQYHNPESMLEVQQTSYEEDQMQVTELNSFFIHIYDEHQKKDFHSLIYLLIQSNKI